MSLLKFESMLKTNSVFFFDLVEFEEIIIHYLDVGKIALAKKAIKLGLEQHPASIDLKLLKVELHLCDNEFDEASKLLKRIEMVAPNNDEVFIQKAAIASKKGAHKQAIIQLQKALDLTDDKLDVWSLIGMEYLYLDDFENARLNFAKCIDVDFEDYSALYNIVYCFDMEQQHEMAIDYLNIYINANPYCEVAWHQLGRQYFILKMYKEALTSFDYAVLIDESFIGGYLEKAKTLEQLGNFEDAIDNYLITIELDDPTAYVYTRVGECYEKLGKFDAAISYYKKAVHEDPLLDKGWVLLANLYYEKENYQKATYYISKALKIDDDNSLHWKHYAEINLKLSFFEEAVTGFKECLKLNDNSLEIYIGLVDVLIFLGEFDEAFQIVLQAQKIFKNFAEVEYRLAGLFYLFNKEKHGFSHLINGLKIDYDYNYILKELFPTVSEKKKIKSLLKNFKKATE
ncbi:tetratricopeptide repeat protein [Polaribacter aestuariivivens]|uniref:Tetratricopeptide repeat protein n=1 Tax=Polaribacter aestuariivivens TaxID=2304626 RepID=A0A5S3N9M2_9FLAO|nr:tetratricopeptide repeat protein [Polaribacter aestuariivivens]TMM31998.1 tetratricopeptide repeat protein [Polaribacter aestuariivivens]